MFLLDQLQRLSPPLLFFALLAYGFLVGLATLVLTRVVVWALGRKDEIFTGPRSADNGIDRSVLL